MFSTLSPPQILFMYSQTKDCYLIAQKFNSHHKKAHIVKKKSILLKFQQELFDYAKLEIKKNN